MDTVVKQRADAPDGFFEAEAAGLRWLGEPAADGGARVVRVVAAGAGRIELERIHEGRPTPAAARAFGAALAVTHAAGAAAFGAPPDGWDGPLFIGRRPLPVAHESSWGRFYARDRVLPYLSIAVEAGGVTSSQLPVIREAVDRVAAGEFDDDEPPARLHGGHRETDLAMLALFGAPYLEEIVASYDTARPLRAGWRGRIPVHQLHPLAVHAAGHGPSYGVALADAARATLAL